MKRFQFSLNTVLSYKQQVLEELQNEHGQLLYQVRQQELVLQAAEERYRGLNLEFRQAETEVLTIAEAGMRAACAFWRMRSSGRPSACGSMRPQRRRSAGR